MEPVPSDPLAGFLFPDQAPDAVQEVAPPPDIVQARVPDSPLLIGAGLPEPLNVKVTVGGKGAPLTFMTTES